VTGDEHGAGRSDALIEETKLSSAGPEWTLGEASHGDGEGAGPVGLRVGTNVGTNEKGGEEVSRSADASNQRQIDRCGPLGRSTSLGA